MTSAPAPAKRDDLGAFGVMLGQSLVRRRQIDPEDPERNAQVRPLPRPFAVHDPVDDLELCGISTELVSTASHTRTSHGEPESDSVAQVMAGGILLQTECFPTGAFTMSGRA